MLTLFCVIDVHLLLGQKKAMQFLLFKVLNPSIVSFSLVLLTSAMLPWP